MKKPADRLQPKAPISPWSNMESWGGDSWFPAEDKEEKDGEVDKLERAERYSDSD